MTYDARPASCMPDACFCEAVRSGGIRQPANAYSSLAFVVVAVVVLFRAKGLLRGRNARGSVSEDGNARALLYAFALLAVGIGSALFHATLSLREQFADVMGMYLVATFALISGLDRLRKLTAAQFIGAYVAMNVVLAIVLYMAPVVRRLVFGLLVVAVLAIEVVSRRVNGHRPPTKHLVCAAAILSVAFLIWILDYTRLICRPESLIQGHAIWHILGAVSAWYLYQYHRAGGEKQPVAEKARSSPA